MAEQEEPRTVQREAELVRAHVDRHADVHDATEGDEGVFLEGEYGAADEAGIYRWVGEGEEPFDAGGLADAAEQSAREDSGLREAVPGEPLPEVDPSAYPPGATPLPPVEQEGS